MEYVPNWLNSFESADLDKVALAIANAQSVSPAPAPAPPLILPEPIAHYDFNFYTFPDAEIASRVGGENNATISVPTLNNFNIAFEDNYYLETFPFGADVSENDLTGGLTIPNFASITAVEMWVKLEYAQDFGAFFLEIQNQGGGYYGGGGNESYWISFFNFTDDIGDNLAGKIYFNAVGQSVLTASGQPGIIPNLAFNSWKQVVLVPSTPIQDTMSLFKRLNDHLGMSMDIAEVLVYDALIDDNTVEGLFNLRCNRYGLPPIV